MFREHGRIVDAVARALDLLALLVAFPVAYLVRDRLFGEQIAGQPGLYPIERYWPLLVLALVAWVAATAYLGLYEPRRMPTIAGEGFRAARVLGVVAAALAGVGFLTKQVEVSRLFVIFYFAVTMALLVANRALLRYGLRALRRRGFTTRIFAVVGTSELARRVAEGIIARREWGYHLAGYVEEDDSPGPRQVGPLLGHVSRLEHLLESQMLDEVIFAVPQERLKDIEAAVLLCGKERVTARICLDAYPPAAKLSIDELNGIPMLGFYR
jgi:FlaA1/EpsC-like NDP-sugar epimerase